MVNSQPAMYTDAKLNAAMRLAQNAEAGKMRQNAYGQLMQQNAQIDAQNNQIGQQEMLQNAQIVQQNAAKQDAHKQWLLSNKLGLTNSNYGAFANRMMEMENKNRMKEQQLQALKDQKMMSEHNTEYQNAYDSFQNQWNDKAKAAGQSWSDYYGAMSELDRNAYIKAKNKLMSNSQNQLLDKRIAEFERPSFFASGGKMTLQEKKELEELKADKKKQLESNKAFNKLMIEKSKSHDKMLSLLSKDMKATVKNILKK